MNYYEIGQRIRRKRKALGLSQEELAENIGISTTHMSHIETGNTKLSLAVFVSIVNALGCQADELLKDLPSPEAESTERILALLDHCTPQELRILEDIIQSTKQTLDKNL